jgi:hypothetical protein
MGLSKFVKLACRNRMDVTRSIPGVLGVDPCVFSINLDPDAIISRLWPKFDLDPSYEKVLLSF